MVLKTPDLTGIGKLQPGSLRARVYARIKELILANRLAPGLELNIDALSAELGVSHTPVREALAMLELDGLVTTSPHKTPRITDIHADDVRQVYEMRILFEGWAAEQAAARLSRPKVEAMRQLLKRARRDGGEGGVETHVAADIALHAMITDAVDNALFRRLYALISNQSVRVRSLVEARSAEHIETILHEHIGILDALASRDATLVRKRLTAHLRSAVRRTLEALQSREG